MNCQRLMQKRGKKPERSMALYTTHCMYCNARVNNKRRKYWFDQHLTNGKLKCARVLQQLNHQATYTTQNSKDLVQKIDIRCRLKPSLKKKKF